MTDKKYLVPKGSRVTIEVNRGKVQSPKPKVQSPKGIIKTRKEDDYQARRLAVGIRFFDLCLKADNSELYESFLPTRTPDGDGELTVDIPNITEMEAETLLEDYRAQVLAIPRETWETVFHQIAESDAFTLDRAITVGFFDDGDYIVEALGDLEQFSGGVLRLTRPNLLNSVSVGGVTIYDGGINFNFVNTEYIVTGEPSPDADVIEFTPSLKMDVFLMPSMVFHQAFVQYSNELHEFTDPEDVDHSDYIQFHELINSIYAPFPREHFAEFIDIETNSASEYERKYRLMRLLTEFPEARTLKLKRDFIEVPPYNYETEELTLSLGDFPFDELYTPSGLDEESDQFDDGYDAGVGVGFIYNQRLVAVIKKGNKFYYLWTFPPT